MLADPFLEFSDFEAGVFPPKDFSVSGDELAFGDKKFTNVRLTAQYDRNATLLLHFETEPDPELLIHGTDLAMLSGSAFPEPISLIPLTAQLGHVTLTPIKQPLLWRRNLNATFVSAILVNGPNLEFAGSRLAFDNDGHEIIVAQFPSDRDLRRVERLHRNERIATAFITLKKSDGSSIDAGSALKHFAHFRRFLTFVRGGNCAIGNIVGYDHMRTIAWAYLGFNACDGFQVERGWSDVEAIARTPEVYRHYGGVVADRDVARVLLRAIDYYRAANVARDSSPEMAIVASYAALETLVPYILGTKGAWTKAQLKDKQPFAKKLSAAISAVGLSVDLLEHAPNLSRRVGADAGGDASRLVALFRNRITHQKQGFSYTGTEALEIWQLSQWLCEVLIFAIIGHRGVMNDRRRYSGWRGPAVGIPLP